MTALVPVHKMSADGQEKWLAAHQPVFALIADQCKTGKLKVEYGMRVKDYGQKGVPRRVPLDDNIRQVARLIADDGKAYLVTRVSPGTTDFLSVYSEQDDQLAFIVGGQPFPVPIDWLNAYNRGIRRVRGKLGHDAPKLNPPPVTIDEEDKPKLIKRLRAAADGIESGEIEDVKRGEASLMEALERFTLPEPVDTITEYAIEDGDVKQIERAK